MEQENPFYFRELPTDGPFCDREQELDDLCRHARSLANVVLFSPRRFGKTSLVKRVQKQLSASGAIPIYVDFYGVTSIEDFASQLATAVFRVTHAHESWFQRAVRAFRSFRPVFTAEPDADKGVKMRVEIADVGKGGHSLLEEVMESLGEFIQETDALVHVVLDEFQEITELREAVQIEGILRRYIQQHRAAYCFVGSRRRILLGIFTDRRRPFYQSALTYELMPLPREEFGEFLSDRFEAAGKRCDLPTAAHLVGLVRSFPYYAQKLAYFAFDMTGETVERRDVEKAFAMLLKEERPALEGVLLGLAPRQIALLKALAKEPTPALYSHDYVRRHRLASGGVRHALKKLTSLDLVERGEGEVWRLVDPVMAAWLA